MRGSFEGGEGVDQPEIGGGGEEVEGGGGEENFVTEAEDFGEAVAGEVMGEGSLQGEKKEGLGEEEEKAEGVGQEGGGPAGDAGGIVGELFEVVDQAEWVVPGAEPE